MKFRSSRVAVPAILVGIALLVRIDVARADVKWAGWKPLPHNGTTDAAVCPVKPNDVVRVYSKGIDSRLIYMMEYSPLGVGDAEWTSWIEITHAPEEKAAEALGVTKKDVSHYTIGNVATVAVNRDVMLFYTDPDGRIRTKDYLEVPGDGLTDSPPFAVLAEPGVHLFVPGKDKKVYTNILPVTESGAKATFGNWSGWSRIPTGDLEGTTDVSVGGCAITPKRIHLFAKGISDGHVYTNVMTSGVWTGWEEVPGGMTTKVALSAASTAPAVEGSSARSNLFLFATRADGTVCMNTITIVSGEAVRHQTWSGWKELPGLVSDASPAVLCDGELWLFVKGPGNAISFNRGNPQ